MAGISINFGTTRRPSTSIRRGRTVGDGEKKIEGTSLPHGVQIPSCLCFLYSGLVLHVQNDNCPSCYGTIEMLLFPPISYTSRFGSKGVCHSLSCILLRDHESRIASTRISIRICMRDLLGQERSSRASQLCQSRWPPRSQFSGVASCCKCLGLTGELISFAAPYPATQRDTRMPTCLGIFRGTPNPRHSGRPHDLPPNPEPRC